MFKKLNYITDKKDRLSIYILFFLLVVSTFVEMLGTGSIKRNPNLRIKKVKFYKKPNFIINGYH